MSVGGQSQSVRSASVKVRELPEVPNQADKIIHRIECLKRLEELLIQSGQHEAIQKVITDHLDSPSGQDRINLK